MNPNTYDPHTHMTVPVGSVVLNPASGVVWEFLQAHKDPRDGHWSGEAVTTHCLKGFRLAQEIRKQMPAPRMSEPTALGSVVRAGGVAGVRRAWTRFRHSQDGACWIDEDKWVCAWADLKDPEVAS